MNFDSASLPADLCHMDEHDIALTKMPRLNDRMVHHIKRLRIIRYLEGVEGVARYKARYPEAISILTSATSQAFQPKPPAYDSFILALVGQWFDSNTSLTATNRADIERLNRAVHPREFNVDNHFSKPASATLLNKVATIFRSHGAHLDTLKSNTLGKVRAAVVAAKGKLSVGIPFGSIGYLTADKLIVGDTSFRTEQHNGHQCVRVTVGSNRVRIRLDALEEFFAITGAGLNSSHYPSIEDRIGEMAPADDRVVKDDPLGEAYLEDWPQPAVSLGERAPKSPLPETPEDQIEQALGDSFRVFGSMVVPPDFDPLNDDVLNYA